MAKTATIRVNMDSGNTSKEIDEIRDKFEEVGATAAKAARAAGKSWEEANVAAEAAFNSVNDSIKQQEANLDILDGTINVIGGSVETLVGGMALIGIDEETQEQFEGMAVGAIAFADGISRTTDGVIKLRKGLKESAAAQKVWTAAQRVFNKVMNANPIFLLVTILAAVAAGIYAIVSATKDDTEATKESIEAKQRSLDIEIQNLEIKKQQDAFFAKNTKERLKIENEAETEILKKRQQAAADAQRDRDQAEKDLEARKISMEEFTEFQNINNDAQVELFNQRMKVRRLRRQQEHTLNNEAIDDLNQEAAVLQAKGVAAEDVYAKQIEAQKEIIKLYGEESNEAAKAYNKIEVLEAQQQKAKDDKAKADREKAIADKKEREQTFIDSQKLINEQENALEEIRISGLDTTEEQRVAEDALSAKRIADLDELISKTKDKELLAQLAAEKQAEINQQAQVVAQRSVDDITAQKDALKSLLEEIDGFEEGLTTEEKIAKLQEEEDGKLAILQQALDDELLTLKEFEDAKAALELEYGMKELALKETLTQKDLENEQMRLEGRQVIQQANLDMARAGVDALIALAGENEKLQNIMFGVEKALAIAEIVVGAQRAIAQSKFNASLVPAVLGVAPNPAYPIAQAIMAKDIATTKITAGTSIASILAASISKYKGGGGGGAIGGAAGAAGGSSVPSFDLPQQDLIDRNAAIFNQEGGSSIKAYVVAGDVQNGMEADQQIQQQRKL